MSISTRENGGGNALPRSMLDVADTFDSSYPMFGKGLGYRNSTKQEKARDPNIAERVLKTNGWLPPREQLIREINASLKRNGLVMEKAEISPLPQSLPPASGSAGACPQQCSCTVHVPVANILAFAKEFEKRGVQSTRSAAAAAAPTLPCVFLTDDRMRGMAATNDYVLLTGTVPTSSDQLVRPPAEAEAADAGTSTTPVYPAQAPPPPGMVYAPIPSTFPTGLPPGPGTKAAKIVRAFEEVFDIEAGGQLHQYPPLLEWTDEKRKGAKLKDGGLFMRRCKMYYGARYACDVEPENNNMDQQQLEKEAENHTKEERERRGRTTKPYWYKKCVDMYHSKQPAK